MPIELSKFTNTDTRDGVAIYRRVVDTPLPANEDGSGYTTERHIQTVYKTGRQLITVRKVSNRGWSVWRYTEGDDGIEIGESYARGLNGQDAQRLGRMKASGLTE